jgi:transketolase N-terminal domain/subunit
MELKDRIIQISKDKGLAHIGSCLSVLPILQHIYAIKKPEDKVLLDGAHAHLAHLVVRNELPVVISEVIFKYGIHCDIRAGCDASGGSLGHALGIGIGLALSDDKRDVYVIVTDGSMMEGSNWEALRLKFNLAITNLRIHCNFNGFSAVAPVNIEKLEWQMRAFCPDITVYHTKNGLGDNKVSDHYIKL